MGKLADVVPQLLVLVSRVGWAVPVICVLHVVIDHHPEAIAGIVEGWREKYAPTPYPCK